MGASNIEVGDIFRSYGAAYRARYKLRTAVLKVMSALEKCRTSALGGHVDVCDTCGVMRNSYNSCCNRHCPKCQGLARERWLLARKQELLPVTYFHVVFTIPDVLNRLALVNQQLVYDILFRAASETLLDLGRDPNHIGAEIGLIAILHTWGQNLMDHPHVHCIVPGGGLSWDGRRWIFPRKAKPDKPFFIHVNVLSDLFKKKFLHYLNKAYNNGELKFVGEIVSLGTPQGFQRLVDKLYSIKWVSYCKRPFGGPKQVMEYLGRYTHRVAISNYRIQTMEDGKVSFKWRDYRDNNREKVMTLDAFEFIRRFLLHVLPKGYCKIRYYGLLSNRHKSSKLKRSKEVLCVCKHEEAAAEPSLDWADLIFQLTGKDPRICPECGQGRMVRLKILPVISHAPP
jgi:hypothetical protein